MTFALLQPVGLTRAHVQCHAKKVNDRGKVSSRPGPLSPKESKRRADEAKKLAREQASAAGTTAPASSEPASPSSSTNSQLPASPPSAQASSSATQPAPHQAMNAPRATPSNSPAVTPQVVVDRIFSRMVTCALIPVAVGIALLTGIFFLKKQGGDDFPMWPAYLSQGFTLMGGLLGISYGALSASWDPSREGSRVGWTEFRANLPIFLNKDKSQ